MICGRAIAAIGDASWRTAALAKARAGVDPAAQVVEVEPPPWRPWGGLAALIDALAVPLTSLTPVHAAALEAAVAGRPIGDHLGIADDLRGLLAELTADRPALVLVPDAHRWDLGSAAALARACADLDGLDLSVVATQAPSSRGLSGVETIRQDTAPVEAPEDDPALPDVDERVALARQAGSSLDLADALEEREEWGEAVTHWLAAGRPDRARRALHRAPAGAASAEGGARLAFTTEPSRAGVAAARAAADALQCEAPEVAARLLLLPLPGLLNRGDRTGVEELLSRAEELVGSAASSRQTDVARELVTLARAVVATADGAGHTGLLDRAERPLARLTEGVPDPDAVALVSCAAMALAWRGAVDDARTLLDRVVGMLENRRSLLTLPFPLATSAWLARRQARFDRALADGHRALDLARWSGAVNDGRFALVEVSHVEAMQGRLDACREHVAELVPPGEEPKGPIQLGAASALAVAELLAGEPARAVEILEPIHRRFCTSVGPNQVAWRHNLVEAYVLTGRVDDATEVFADLERWVDREQSPSERSLGQLERARGMLAPADRYDEHFRRAAAHLASYPGLRWRSAAQHVRRLLEDGRRAEAETLGRELLDEADTAGVAAGADQLRRMLSRHGIATERRRPAATSLSIAHLRVAMLLADGADELDIAEQLRVSRAAVGAARHRILDALEVADLDELSDRMGTGPRQPVADEDVPTTVVLLGPLAVVRGGERLSPPPGRPATLLGFVALQQVVHLEQVLDVLWPDASVGEARARLRNVLARLRSSVGDVVVRDGDQLRVADGIDVDVQRFSALAARARAADLSARPALVCDALEAWTGAPLPAWPYDDWAIRAGDQLRATYLELLDERARLLLAEGRNLEAATALADPAFGDRTGER